MGLHCLGSPALLVQRGQSESCDPVGSNRSFGQPCRLLPVRYRGGAKNRQRRGTPRRCCTPLALNSTKSAEEPLSGRKSRLGIPKRTGMGGRAVRKRKPRLSLGRASGATGWKCQFWISLAQFGG